MQSDLFGVGNILWETLTAERLFDGKNDVEIFKKIRACTVPSLAQRRPDVPAQLVKVLDIALAADPNNRYGSAPEFAHALGQVMKQAVGVDPAVALGTAVREIKTHQAPEVTDDMVTTSGTALPKRGSTDLEFSTADLSVEPIPLTKPKKPS